MRAVSTSNFWGTRAVLPLIALAAAAASWARADPPAKVPPPTPATASDPILKYNRDIRPILSASCFACHGPDSAARKADLRLDVRDDAIAAHRHGTPIVPGKPDASELIRRIASDDTDVMMPPPESKLSLSNEHRDALRRWIEQGAAYEPHWSFQRLPESVPLPAVESGSWVRDPLDHFVLASLERVGLSPSPDAGRVRWLRRVTYDLTGLPPAPEEIDAFLADGSDDAYENVVDRLLESAAFGERMAVPWLDAARYADSYGYQSDLLSPTWPWRDWVVRAFNDDMPYDEFLVRQLAGDLLPGATRDDRLATAFNRLHRMTNEGGSIPEEWRTEYTADRVETFSSAFLGLTMQCARCHDHKYDPVTQREYYQFASYFNSIDEHGLYERSDIVPTPSLLLPTPEQTTRLDELGKELRDREADAQRIRDSREPAFMRWRDSPARETPMPDVVGRFDLDEIGVNGELRNEVGESAGLAESGIATSMPRVVEGRGRNALEVDGDNLAHLPGVGDLDRWTPFTISLWLRVDKVQSGEKVVAHRSSGTDAGHYGFDLMLEGGRLTARVYRHWPGNAIAAQTVEPAVPVGEWTHIVWRYDGSSAADGLAIFVNGERTQTTVVRDHLWKSVGGGTTYGPGGTNLILGQRFRDSGLVGGQFDTVVIVRRCVTDIEARCIDDLASLGAALESADEASLREYYFSAVDQETRAAEQSLSVARRAVAEFEDGIAEIMVMEELPRPRPTHVLARGSYDAPKTPDTLVRRGAPRVLETGTASPRDRLELSRWVTGADHPLTSRVAVNRLWQLCFGRGLVETSDNFGVQGSPPTHPELLDYLAREFVDSRWDTKAMLKRIVLSATYRQDSVPTPELLSLDPHNALLARGPRRRLDAEMIRDTALAASGLLVRTVGGPPAHPYQPPGLWREFNTFSPEYEQGSADQLYRRSLYTVWKRTAPMPSMTTLDSPGREQCVPRRAETNTPLQALVLLNDVQFVEAARVLAQSAMHEAADDGARMTLIFRRLCARAPTPREHAVLLALLDEQRSLYEARPADAANLIAVGDSPADASLDAADLAAFTVVCQAVLNLDATVWLR